MAFKDKTDSPKYTINNITGQQLHVAMPGIDNA
jgi:hypothetical protein